MSVRFRSPFTVQITSGSFLWISKSKPFLDASNSPAWARSGREAGTPITFELGMTEQGKPQVM